MGDIERWECPEHGDALAARPRTIRDKRVKACGICGQELVHVRYVRASQLEGAVKRCEELNEMLNAEINAKARYARLVEELCAELGRPSPTIGVR